VVAEGYDPNEVPITGLVDNQSTQVQASVQSAFGASAQLLSLQYDNAGSNYFEETTNLLTYSNNFITGTWLTDGNVLLQQNLLSPIDETNAWTFTAQTSSTDSSYVYQDTVIPATGKIYTNIDSLNVTGSGGAATFDITVSSTQYLATVNSGGTGYVVGNILRIPGSQLGGEDGTNDCFLTVASLAGSSILSVTVTGTVPEGSAQSYTFSIYTKKGTASSIDLEMIFSGNTSVSSSINFNYDNELITASNNGTAGIVPTEYGILPLENGWYRIWITAYDSIALNNSLRVRI